MSVIGVLVSVLLSVALSVALAMVVIRRSVKRQPVPLSQAEVEEIIAEATTPLAAAGEAQVARLGGILSPLIEEFREIETRRAEELQALQAALHTRIDSEAAGLADRLAAQEQKLSSLERISQGQPAPAQKDEVDTQLEEMRARIDALSEVIEALPAGAELAETREKAAARMDELASGMAALSDKVAATGGGAPPAAMSELEARLADQDRLIRGIEDRLSGFSDELALLADSLADLLQASPATPVRDSPAEVQQPEAGALSGADPGSLQPDTGPDTMLETALTVPDGMVSIIPLARSSGRAGRTDGEDQ